MDYATVNALSNCMASILAFSIEASYIRIAFNETGEVLRKQLMRA